MAARGIVGHALLAFAAYIEGEKHVVADLERLVLHVTAQGSDDARAFMAENCRKRWTRQQTSLQENVLSPIRFLQLLGGSDRATYCVTDA